MVEYIVGPVLALVLGLKFTDYKVKEMEKRVEEIARSCEERVIATNTQTSKTIVATLTPVARAIKQLNEQVGIEQNRLVAVLVL